MARQKKDKEEQGIDAFLKHDVTEQETIAEPSEDETKITTDVTASEVVEESSVTTDTVAPVVEEDSEPAAEDEAEQDEMEELVKEVQGLAALIDDEQDMDAFVVSVDFITESVRVGVVVTATNQVSELLAINGILKMVYGRMYYVPVDCNIDSDEYGSMKIPSEIADKLDVRYVKNGIACVKPIINGFQLKRGQKLCIIF